MAAHRLTRCLAALVALLLACKGKSPPPAERVPLPPALGTVTVMPIPTVDFRGQSLRLDDARLAAKVRSTLVDAGIFATPDGKRAMVVAAVEVQPFTEGSVDAVEMGVKLRLRMMVRPEGQAAPRFNEDTVAVGQAPLETRDPGAAQAAFDRLAERVAGEITATYVARQRLWSGSPKDVETALSSTDNEVRMEALRIIGERKLRALLPAVLRLLSDDDEGVRDAALGAIVVLKERSAVRALAESRQMRDAREMRKVLDAIASLGGPEARDYLAFVAENHDDEEIREMARLAIERLMRQTGKAQPTK